MLLDLDLKLRTPAAYRAFGRLARDPERAQAEVLQTILRGNARSAFGRDHAFVSLKTVRDFQAAVPIRSYDQLEQYMRRVAAGEPQVLTGDAVTMLATTSGTTGDPKMIPVTETSRRSIARLIRLWMGRCAADHPGCFAGTTLAVSAPAVEGFTSAGIPYGSMSGVTYERLPGFIRGQFAVPYAVTLIRDPELRYFLTMRFALAGNVSSIATPNAMTLLRLCEVTRRRTDDLLRAIHDGALGASDVEFIGAADASAARRSLRRACRRAPGRSRTLAVCARDLGYLRPHDAWPKLALIGCWLGGTAGRHAARLSEVFDGVPKRDLGLIATEGRMSIPLMDETASGPPALGDLFFEFVPEGEESAEPRSLLLHELEVGGRYRVVITGRNGLYRYDMNDIVEVTGHFHRSPTVAFVRKGADFVNITGEKLHVNQIGGAIQRVELGLGLNVVQFRLIPDVDAARYDLLLEGLRADHDLEEIAGAFDAALRQLNVEYASKRASSRLLGPRVFAMRGGWAERQARADFANGMREHQYKFACLRDGWDAASRQDVDRSFEPPEADRA